MRRILARATLVALMSVVVSLLLMLSLVTAFGYELRTVPVLMALICPLLVAFPVSFHSFRQKQKLSDALAELTCVHEELATAYARLAETHARLAEQARHDGMTGLLNREAFMAALKSSRRRTDGGALLLVDADHFKQINDRHGHQAGDDALVQIADAIRKGVRKDDLVARIGGEEFAVFLNGTDEDEALIAAERIRLGVEAIRFWPKSGTVLPLSVSIGAVRMEPGASWPQMMREANRRLYEAKQQGRNRVVFGGKERTAA